MVGHGARQEVTRALPCVCLPGKPLHGEGRRRSWEGGRRDAPCQRLVPAPLLRKVIVKCDFPVPPHCCRHGRDPGITGELRESLAPCRASSQSPRLPLPQSRKRNWTGCRPNVLLWFKPLIFCSSEVCPHLQSGIKFRVDAAGWCGDEGRQPSGSAPREHLQGRPTQRGPHPNSPW